MATGKDSHRRELETQNAAASPVINALDQFGTQWRLNVVYALEDGEQRFNELKRATGARSKTLSNTLDELVEHEIVSRRTEDASPIAVYYGLTPKGTDLIESLEALETWTQNWSSESTPTDHQDHPRS